GSADAAPESYRNQDDIGFGQLVEDLQCVRADTSDQVRLIRRVNVTKSFPMADGLAMLAGFIVISADFDQLGPERSHGGSLVWIVVRRHHHDAADAKQKTGIGQRLPVVTGRAAKDAIAFLLVSKACHEVNGAAYLE